MCSAPATALLPGARYFLWVSNFYSYKRAELALRAYAGLPLSQARGHEPPLVLVGGDWLGGCSRAQAEVPTTLG